MLHGSGVPLKATHPIISPPADTERKRFSDLPPPPAPGPALNRYSDSITATPSRAPLPNHGTASLTRRSSRTADGMPPPPPPPRDPRTRLSGSTENVPAAGQPRKGSFSTFQSNRPPLYENNTLPKRRSAAEANDADDDLPAIPPPLPLYTPRAVIERRKELARAESLPPPPEELLYEVPLSAEGRGHDEGFPPPPPTL